MWKTLFNVSFELDELRPVDFQELEPGYDPPPEVCCLGVMATASPRLLCTSDVPRPEDSSGLSDAKCRTSLTCVFRVNSESFLNGSNRSSSSRRWFPSPKRLLRRSRIGALSAGSRHRSSLHSGACNVALSSGPDTRRGPESHDVRRECLGSVGMPWIVSTDGWADQLREGGRLGWRNINPQRDRWGL